jgi:hypothetical protein
MSSVSQAQDVTTVRYTKSELDHSTNQQFIKTQNLHDVLAAKLSLIATTVTSRQNGGNTATKDVAGSAGQLSEKLWMRKLSTLSFDPDTAQSRGDTDKLRTTLSAQSRKATEVKFKEAFPAIVKLQQGLNFKFDLKGKQESTKENSVPEIRYGLVESDIEPNKGSTSIASLGSISDSELRYSSPAKVVYSIEKLDNGSTHTVFSEPTVIDDPEKGLPATQNVDLWYKSPSSRVDMKVEATDPNSAVTDQVGQGAIPGAQVTLKQVDDLIKLQFVAGANAKDSIVTEYKVPVFREMSISRKYNHEMKPIETSAQNILADSKKPRFNIYYANVEKKCKAEWIVKKSNYDYNITAEPRPGWSVDDERALGKEGDKISLGFNTSF